MRPFHPAFILEALVKIVPYIWVTLATMAGTVLFGDRPKVKTYAAKWWDSDEGCHMLLYYPDRLERYIAPGKQMADMRTEESGKIILRCWLQTDFLWP